MVPYTNSSITHYANHNMLYSFLAVSTLYSESKCKIIEFRRLICYNANKGGGYVVFVWIAVTVAFIIIEAITTQLLTIWFAAGAAAAVIATLLDASPLVQCIVFVAVSLIALIATRPLVKKLTKQKFSPTNADRFIGETAIVTENISNIAQTGLVKLQGTVWTARSADGEAIPEGETVTVKKIEGVKLIVEKTALPAEVKS